VTNTPDIPVADSVPSVPDQVREWQVILDLLRRADEAVGLLVSPVGGGESPVRFGPVAEGLPEDHWRWRLAMAERIAAKIDAVTDAARPPPLGGKD